VVIIIIIIIILTEIFTYRGTSPSTIRAPIVRPVNVLQLCRRIFRWKAAILRFLSPLWGTYRKRMMFILEYASSGKRVMDLLLVIIDFFR